MPLYRNSSRTDSGKGRELNSQSQCPGLTLGYLEKLLTGTSGSSSCFQCRPKGDVLSLWCMGRPWDSRAPAPSHRHKQGPAGSARHTSPTESRIPPEEPGMRAAIPPCTYMNTRKLLFPMAISSVCTLNSRIKPKSCQKHLSQQT